MELSFPLPVQEDVEIQGMTSGRPLAKWHQMLFKTLTRALELMCERHGIKDWGMDPYSLLRVEKPLCYVNINIMLRRVNPTLEMLTHALILISKVCRTKPGFIQDRRMLGLYFIAACFVSLKYQNDFPIADWEVTNVVFRQGARWDEERTYPPFERELLSALDYDLSVSIDHHAVARHVLWVEANIEKK
jgi:hypothetical protein